MAVDLAQYDGVEALYEAIASQGRPLDVIAINAGVGAGGDFVRDIRLDDNLNVVDLNVRSTVLTTAKSARRRKTIPPMWRAKVSTRCWHA